MRDRQLDERDLQWEEFTIYISKKTKNDIIYIYFESLTLFDSHLATWQLAFISSGGLFEKILSLLGYYVPITNIMFYSYKHIYTCTMICKQQHKNCYEIIINIIIIVIIIIISKRWRQNFYLQSSLLVLVCDLCLWRVFEKRTGGC